MNFKKTFGLIFCLLLFYMSTHTAFAATENTPVGIWQTVDDISKQPRATVSLYIRQGQLFGKILKIIPQPGDTGKCNHCPGRFKNKSIVHLEFVWGLKPVTEGKWVGGYIIDPKKGNIYRCNMTLMDHGKKLKVRGYVGVTLLGRTQYWYRLK